ncbi:MAG: hypothetical protein PWQ74_725 [Methanobacteriaceae archaeon]|nr:hypothetical protein [Methanobacteriaceae archaeon]
MKNITFRYDPLGKFQETKKVYSKNLEYSHGQDRPMIDKSDTESYKSR